MLVMLVRPLHLNDLGGEFLKYPVNVMLGWIKKSGSWVLPQDTAVLQYGDSE